MTRAVASAATALPSPATVCSTTSAGWDRARAHPVAIPTAEASCKHSTKRKSPGSADSIGTSVEPGLQNMVVKPCSRSTPKAASRTLR